MFKLVGKEYFKVGKSNADCCIAIEAVSGFAYEYSVEVKSFIQIDGIFCALASVIDT